MDGFLKKYNPSNPAGIIIIMTDLVNKVKKFSIKNYGVRISNCHNKVNSTIF